MHLLRPAFVPFEHFFARYYNDRSTCPVRLVEASHAETVREQVGVKPAALTAAEAGYIIGFRDADSLRARAAAARRERVDRLRAKGTSDEGEVGLSDLDREPLSGWGHTGEGDDFSVNGRDGKVLTDETSKADAEALRSTIESHLQRSTPNARVPAGAFEVVALPGESLLRRIAEAFGVRVVGFRVNDPKLRFFGGATNIQPGVIYILEDNPRPHLSILGHELLHNLRKDSPALYEQFRRAIQPYVTQHWKRIGKDAPAWKHHADDKLLEKLLADLVGDGFLRRDFWQRLGEKNPGLLQRVYNALLMMVDKVWKSLGGRAPTPRMREYMLDFQAAVRIAADVMAQYGKSVDQTAAQAAAIGAVPQPGFYLTDEIKARANEGMPMFAGIERDRTVIDTANRRVARFVDEFLAGRMKDSYTQVIGPTPTVLQAVGAPALDVQIDGALVRKVLVEKHKDGMSPEMFKAMPEGLYNPLAVFDSPDENGQPGRLVLTEATDRNGEPVIIAVHLERSPHRIRINDVASMYGLERAKARLAKLKLLYVRNDKGPAPSTKPANLFLAGMVQAARGRGEIVLTERDVVNRFGPSFDRLDDGPTTPLPGLGTVTRQRIGDHLRAAFDSSRTFNPWHRTVGTQFHKAWVDDHFRPVFEETQQFLFDTSQFTMDATHKAQSLLPRFERVGDVLRDAKGRAAQEKDLDGRSRFLVTSSGVAGYGGKPDRVSR